jgi:hypothetical protein
MLLLVDARSEGLSDPLPPQMLADASLSIEPEDGGNPTMLPFPDQSMNQFRFTD